MIHSIGDHRHTSERHVWTLTARARGTCIREFLARARESTKADTLPPDAVPVVKQYGQKRFSLVGFEFGPRDHHWR
jgi:hypothetical protein